jgi:GNAT superfamily N-acetyltransferase
VHPQARRAGHGSRLLNAAVDTLRGRQFTRLSGWVLADDEATRAFLVGSGLSPDGAYRDRVVDPDGTVVREVRLVADLATA